MKKLIFFILLILFFIVNNSLKIEENKIYEFESKQKLNIDLRIQIYKLLGFRKAASSVLWVQQGLQVGDIIAKNEEREFKINQLYSSSLNISYLDPYFIQNYYTSSTTLAFIKTLKAHKEAMEILQLGIRNNPNEKLFKRYAGAVLASANNDTEQLIEIIESILLEEFDEEMTIFLSKIYEQKYYKTKNKMYLYKTRLLLKKIYKDGIEKNRKYAIEKFKVLEELE